MLEMGQDPEHRTLEPEEKKEALLQKITEEAGEGDLPDLLEVIEALAELEGKSFEEIREAQLAKRKKVGGFKDGTYVGSLTLSDDDKWVEYYAAEPERFPEIIK